MGWLIFILLVCFFLVYFTRRKKRIKVDYEKIHRQREAENAPKILYLRAFDVDGDDGSNGNISFLKLLPKEMDLAEQLINLPYHLVAVGRPNEEVPEIGFDRKKFSDDKWQDAVLRFMKESEMIIWRPDTSHGLFWELSKIFELNYRNKLVVWTEMGYENLIDVQKTRYDIFARKANQQFEEIFPPFNRYKQFIVSKEKDHWEAFMFIQHTPLFNKISGEK